MKPWYRDETNIFLAKCGTREVSSKYYVIRTHQQNCNYSNLHYLKNHKIKSSIHWRIDPISYFFFSTPPPLHKCKFSIIPPFVVGYLFLSLFLCFSKYSHEWEGTLSKTFSTLIFPFRRDFFMLSSKLSHQEFFCRIFFMVATEVFPQQPIHHHYLHCSQSNRTFMATIECKLIRKYMKMLRGRINGCSMTCLCAAHSFPLEC